ncbi:MAG: hypothetical protein NTX56_04470 [Proteobacteria bacterium]|nr:hypothetical protein [Pseudomonadota bacterium]
MHTDNLFIGPMNITDPTNKLQPYGIGPVGNFYLYNIVPLAKGAANVAALQQLAGAGNFALTAGTGVTTATSATGTALYVFDVPRAVSFTSTGNISGRTFTVYGYDVYGAPMTASRAGPNNNTVNTTKAFASVYLVSSSGAVATNTSIGTSDVLGLPVAVANAGYVVHAGWDATLANDAGTFVAAVTTSPATATTGDVRGTYTPSSAADGSKRLALTLALPGGAVGATATQAGAYGVTQV